MEYVFQADYRLRCLKDYFTNYDGTCDVVCLRVILVDIEITKVKLMQLALSNLKLTYVKISYKLKNF